MMEDAGHRDGKWEVREKGGMTLVEVMLAVLILSVGMIALLTASSRCLAVMKSAKNYQDVLWTLSTAEAEHIIYPTNNIEDMAVAREKYGEMTFERIIDEDEDKDGLYVIRTIVSWPHRGKETSEEILSYIYIKPDEKDKAASGTTGTSTNTTPAIAPK